eukprot:356541-Chlamydomonas_euryale.AAC.4
MLRPRPRKPEIRWLLAPAQPFILVPCPPAAMAALAALAALASRCLGCLGCLVHLLPRLPWPPAALAALAAMATCCHGCVCVLPGTPLLLLLLLPRTCRSRAHPI